MERIMEIIKEEGNTTWYLANHPEERDPGFLVIDEIVEEYTFIQKDTVPNYTDFHTEDADDHIHIYRISHKVLRELGYTDYGEEGGNKRWGF
jgi:hypothetical protein